MGGGKRLVAEQYPSSNHVYFPQRNRSLLSISDTDITFSSRTRINLYPENQYQRLLVHRCAAYYRLAPEIDPNSRERSGSNREMTIVITIESKM